MILGRDVRYRVELKRQDGKRGRRSNPGEWMRDQLITDAYAAAAKALGPGKSDAAFAEIANKLGVSKLVARKARSQHNKK